MMAAFLSQANPTFHSAFSQKSLLFSAVVIYTPVLNNKELPPYLAFHKELQKCKPLEKEFIHYKKLMCSISTSESALVKKRLSEKPPAGAENYSYLQKKWEQEKML